MDSVATNSIFFVGGLLVAISILVSSVSSRVGIPILVIFMGVGMQKWRKSMVNLSGSSVARCAYVLSHSSP